MKNISEVLRSIRYIEENLKEPISIESAARAAGYSLYHFIRIFNSLTGHSPYDYIMRRRLSEAAKELRENGRKITDVAFDYQFNNLETFSRGFKKMFDALPNKIREGSFNLVLKSPVTYDYLEHINRCNFFIPEMVEIGPMVLAGMVLNSTLESDAIEEHVWEGLRNELGSVEDNSVPKKCFSVSFYPMQWHYSPISRIMCTEIKSLDEIPPAFVGKTIPSLRCIRFIHKGPFKNIGLTYDYIYQTWVPKSGCEVVFPYSIEKYGKEDYMEPEIWVLVPIEMK